MKSKEEPRYGNPNVYEIRKLVYWLQHVYSPFAQRHFKCIKRMKSKEEPRYVNPNVYEIRELASRGCDTILWTCLKEMLWQEKSV